MKKITQWIHRVSIGKQNKLSLIKIELKLQIFVIKKSHKNMLVHLL